MVVLRLLSAYDSRYAREMFARCCAWSTLLLIAMACEGRPSTHRKLNVRASSAATRAPLTTQPALLASASPLASGNGSLDAGAPSGDLVHCKALGKRGLVSIAQFQEDLVDMTPEFDHVLVLTFHPGLGRVTLTRVRRDGSSKDVVSRQSGVGEPKPPTWAPDAVYFTRQRNLYRMPLAGGESVLVAKGFSYSVAVGGGYAYGVTCDAKKSFDSLVRVAVGGGNLEPFADIEHTKPAEQDPGTFVCNYGSLVVDDKAVYLTHWNGRRVLRVDLESRATTSLAIKASYPSDLYLEDANLLFRASGGVYRTSKTEANAVRVTNLGSAPFTMVAYDSKALFTHESDPYATEECTYEVSSVTGKANKRDCFKAERPDEFPPDVGVRGIAVDDECIYTMRKHQKYTALYARSR